MKKLKPLPQKTRIKGQIKELFDMLRPGDQLRTDDVVRYVKRNLGKQFYPDSGIRYMREMRQADTNPKTTSDSNLPTLYAHHDRMIQEYMESTFGNTKTTKSRSLKISSSAGYNAGREAADNINLNTQLSQPSTQRPLSY